MLVKKHLLSWLRSEPMNYILQVKNIDMKIKGNDGNSWKSIKLAALGLVKIANLHQNLHFLSAIAVIPLTVNKIALSGGVCPLYRSFPL